jgi:hypothetical protein
MCLQKVHHLKLVSMALSLIPVTEQSASVQLCHLEHNKAAKYLNFASVIARFIAHSYALYYDCRMLQFNTRNNITIHNEAPGNAKKKKKKKKTEFIFPRE